MKLILLLFMAASAIQSPYLPAPDFTLPDTVWILHYTETTEYNHNTWNRSLAFFEDLADSMTSPLEVWMVVQDGNGSEFNSLPNLQKYKAIVFSNTSGSSGLSLIQRQNMESYIAGGGSFVGIHAASDTYRHSSANGSNTGIWDWYAENLTGASVQKNPSHTGASHVDSIMIWNTIFSGNLPAVWIKREEFYFWENGYLNSADFNEVARTGRTGSSSHHGPRMSTQYRDLPGGGIAFYTAMGHSKDNFEDSEGPNDEFYFFRVMLLNVLKALQQPAFFIQEPEPAPAPTIELGFFILESQPVRQEVKIYTRLGELKAVVPFEGHKVPIYPRQGIWVYHVPGIKPWTHGTFGQ